MNNNKMERLNGEIRDREKVMRGLKKDYTPVLKGYKISRAHQLISLQKHAGSKDLTVSDLNGIFRLV